MAAHVFVIDSSARRQQIKTTPGTYLRDVLDEACKKFGKDPEHFMLTDSSRPPKTLDLSLTLRLSGLVNGAKLQLVQGSRSPSVINVAIKLPPSVGDGQRLQDKFPSNTSLWLVLRKFEEAVAGQTSRKLNLTQRGIPSTDLGAGRLVYEQPVVKIMQREMADFVTLQKTLAQLGFNNGSVLLQLEFRNSGIPMEEAVGQISQYFGVASPTDPEVPTATANADKPSVPDTTAAGDAASPAINAQTVDSPMPDASAEEPSLPASSTSTPPPQADGIAIYKAPSASMPLAALQSTSESDFIPTIEHAHAHQAVLARAAQNQRLASDAELAAANERRREAQAAVRTAVVRSRFPDQMQADLTIDATATESTLQEKVRAMLRDESLQFELRYPGPKGTPVALAPGGAKALIRDLGWRGRVLVTMVWATDVPAESRARVLKDSLVGQARELSVPVPTTEKPSQATSDKKEKPKAQAKGTTRLTSRQR